MKSKNLIVTVAVLLMTCLSAFAIFSDVSSVEQAAETEIITEEDVPKREEKPEIVSEVAEKDIKAPEGILKGNFLVAWETVTPDNFVEQITDSSEYIEGFRNVRMMYKEDEVEEILKSAMEELDIIQDKLDFVEIFQLNWDASKDCFEEQDFDVKMLENCFAPSENGLYEMEVVAADAWRNASVAKVFVLYDSKTVAREKFEAYVEQNIVSQEQKDGLDRSKAEEAFVRVNEQRMANGVEVLAWDESLYELASIRAQEIISNFSHQRPDGSYVGDVMLGQYGFSGCGENIAANYTSVTNLVNGWMNSDGHRENLLNGQFSSGVMACYCHEGSYYWVNLFRQ